MRCVDMSCVGSRFCIPWIRSVPSHHIPSFCVVSTWCIMAIQHVLFRYSGIILLSFPFLLSIATWLSVMVLNLLSFRGLVPLIHHLCFVVDSVKACSWEQCSGCQCFWYWLNEAKRWAWCTVQMFLEAPFWISDSTFLHEHLMKYSLVDNDLLIGSRLFWQSVCIVYSYQTHVCGVVGQWIVILRLQFPSLQLVIEANVAYVVESHLSKYPWKPE